MTGDLNYTIVAGPLDIAAPMEVTAMLSHQRRA
jgi:hypothetical protein